MFVGENGSYGPCALLLFLSLFLLCIFDKVTKMILDMKRVAYNIFAKSVRCIYAISYYTMELKQTLLRTKLQSERLKKPRRNKY